MTTNELFYLLIIGLLGGLLSGALGVAGGIIIIPALVFFLGLSQQQAQGTFLALMVLPVFIVAAYTYYKNGFVNIKYSLIMMITFVLGTFIGAKFAVYINPKILQKVFAVVLIVVAVRMLFSK
jgi:uncharacterized protein